MATTLRHTHCRIFAAPLEDQGIVTILNSDAAAIPDCSRPAPSIRRTLSADMSSRKWLEQNGMKKVVSSQELTMLPSDDDDEFEKQRSAPPMADVWSSIMMCQKKDETSAPPYVHPLLKRSSSALSGKSLQICTESLGSETGSDCFSADEGKDGEIRVLDEELMKQEIQFGDKMKQEIQFGDFIPSAPRCKKPAPARPSPPPIPSISGDSVHISSRRGNGRLVVEAVSVPPRNIFQAQRRDGRLVLSLIRTPPTTESENDNEKIPEEGAAGEDSGSLAVESLSSVNKPDVMKPKFIPIRNRNPKAEKEEEKLFTVAQSLPPLGSKVIRSPTSASLNADHYFWREMPAVTKRRLNGVNGDVRKAEYYGPHLSGCKDGRRSVFIWEPYCIAT